MTTINSKLDFSAFLRMQEIEDELENAVISGELADGSTVELKTLAKQFKITKNDMLAAVYNLIDAGFFANCNHPDKFAIRYNSHEAADLGQVRLKTEKNTLVTAMKNISDIDVELCRKHLSIFENNPGTAKGLSAHLDFFETVYFGRIGGSGVTKTEKNLLKYCKYLRIVWSNAKQLEIYCQGLRHFLDLCDRGQGKDAQKAMLQHITETGEYIVKQLTARVSKSSDQTLTYAPAQPA
ncbi:hypothetical protein [Methylobacterium komagatae]